MQSVSFRSLHQCMFIYRLPPRRMPFSSPEIVLTSSPDGPITAYDTFSGTILARFTGSQSPRGGLAVTGNGYVAASHICSTRGLGSIHLYNWWSPTALHHLPVPEPVAPLAATLDGLFLFAGGLSGNVHVLSNPSGIVIRTFPTHDKAVSCLRISNDSSLLISGGDDGVIAVAPIFQLVETTSHRDMMGSPMLQRFVAHDGPVTAITSCMGFCQAIIISCSTDCTCKWWSLSDGTNLRTVTFPCVISGIALDPAETEFYAAGSDGLIYKGFLKAEGKKRVCELVTWGEKHGGAVVSVMTVNEGKNLVSAAEEGSVYIWEVGRGQVTMVLGNNMESVSDLVVASGICEGNWQGRRPSINMNEFSSGGGCGSVGISGAELMRSARDTADMEDALTVSTRDRSKAIDMLEYAIGEYERLLELILKEAQVGTRRNSQNR